MGRWFLVPRPPHPDPYVSISYLGLVFLPPVIVSVFKVPISGINTKAIPWASCLGSCVSVCYLASACRHFKCIKKELKRSSEVLWGFINTDKAPTVCQASSGPGKYRRDQDKPSLLVCTCVYGLRPLDQTVCIRILISPLSLQQCGCEQVPSHV